jgi:hypothetical protein
MLDGPEAQRDCVIAGFRLRPRYTGIAARNFAKAGPMAHR